ncbi:hypothetical protein GYA13_03635 [Candidatus Kuenenbacteria bacterium]|nr:hypothetical protein [Candidatus Kuenenbacteria bacterium]
MMKNAKPKTPTQNYIDIAEIHDDVVIMRDNTLVAILLVASINFDLKSAEEQNAIIQGYISFINSLSFPVQIVIQSRRLDIAGYLEKLKVKEKEQTNELLKIQIKEYSQYIKELVELGDIMSKKFYVVVPYNPQEGFKKQGLVAKTLNSFKAVQIVSMRNEKFVKYKLELNRRIETVQSGLNSMMVNSQQLDTQSLIELFYNTYNPDISGQQKMVEVGKLQAE